MRYFDEYCEIHLDAALAPHRWVFRAHEPILIRFGVALTRRPAQGAVAYQVGDGTRPRARGRVTARALGVTRNHYQLYEARLPSLPNGCYRYRLGYRDAAGVEYTSTKDRQVFVCEDAPRGMADIGAVFLDVIDGIPLYGPPPQVPITPGPRVWHDRLFYSLITDRFARAPTGDRAGLGPVKLDPDSAHAGHGGTLRGITARLPYLRTLGVGVIVLSPVYTNNSAGYHGYYATHLLMVDPGQGTLAELRELVAQAHGLGMAVVLDVICNHIGDSISWRPQYAGTVGEFHYIDGRRSYMSQRGLLTGCDYVGNHEDAVLPYPVEARDPALFHGTEYTDIRRQRLFGMMEDWRTEINYVRDLLIDHLKYWIAATDIDGFRHDAARHIEPEFWETCVAEIDRYARYLGKTAFLQIAEHAGHTAAELAEYNRARFPGLLDFPTFYRIVASLDAPNRLQGLADYFSGWLRPTPLYGRDWRDNVIFLDGHDRTRILHELRVRLPTPAVAQTCFHFALCCLILGPQTPVLYYGTEQEFTGALGTYYRDEAGEWSGHDCYVREDMFDNPGCTWQFGPLNRPAFPAYSTEHDTFQLIRRLAGLRGRYSDQLRGERTELTTGCDHLRCLLLHDGRDEPPLFAAMNFGIGAASAPALAMPQRLSRFKWVSPLAVTAAGTVQCRDARFNIFLPAGAFFIGQLAVSDPSTRVAAADLPMIHATPATPAAPVGSLPRPRSVLA